RAIGREARQANPGEFVMPGKSRPAGHDRHPTHAEDIVVDVAESPRIERRTLLRHAHPFRALNENELRIVDVVSFDERAIPRRRSRRRWQDGSRNVVVGAARSAIDDVAKALPEPLAIPSVLGHDLKVQLAEVKQSDKSLAMEGLVADARAGDQ